jgi:type IV pilus assembly protein PilB
MVGEIRDSETAEIAVRASLTGHLVLSTIHTNNAISTLNRLADMGIERYLIASSLACITAQRLVRTNCPNCSTAAEATAEETQLLYSKGMIAEEDLPRLRLMKGQGCGSCGHTGYQGRMAIHEVLVIDQEIRSFMSSAEQLAGMEQSLHGKGYRTMLDDGLFKVLEGKTTVQEVLRAAFSE